MSMHCRQFEELVGAYVLWALPLPERMLADAHVRECKRCRQLACELQQTAQQLPFMVAPATPGPQVRQRIIAAIEAEAAKEEALQAYPSSRSDTVRKIAESPIVPYLVRDSVPASSEQASSFKSKTAPRLVRKGGGPRHPGQSQLGWFQLAIAAVLLLALSGGTLYRLWQLNQRPLTVVQTGQSGGTPEGSVASQGQGQHGGSDLITYPLHGLNTDATMSGQAIYDPQLRQIVLLVYHLSPLSGTQLYQGWLLRAPAHTSGRLAPGKAGRPVAPLTESVGVLVIHAHGGQAALRFTIPGGDIHAYSAIAVSREPGPYASPAAPRGPVVALGLLVTHTQSGTHGS